MKRLFLLFNLLFLIKYSTMAYDFEVDGLYYQVTSYKDATVGVTTGNEVGIYKGKIVIPENVEYEGVVFKVTEIMASAFSDCRYLSNVEIGGNVVRIGSGAFYNCPMLHEILIPNNVNTIGAGAFKGCSCLERFIIADGDTDINLLLNRQDGNGMFADSKNPWTLQTLYIGRNIIEDSLDWYDDGSFGCLTKINLVELGPNVKEISKNFFVGRNINGYQAFTPVNFLAIHSSDFDCNTSTYPICRTVVVAECILNQMKKSVTKASVYPLAEVNFYECQNADSYHQIVDSRDKHKLNYIAFWDGLDSSISEESLKGDMNPNCLYFVPENAALCGKNIVNYTNSEVDEISIDAKFSFKSPMAVSAKRVSMFFEPSIWADGKNGWESLVLPFEPQYIEASESGCLTPITTGSTGDFWMRQYVGASNDAVHFASTADGVMKANTPYLVAFPGDKMGKGSLEGQTITFKAKNVTLPITEAPTIQKNGFIFTGNYDAAADEGAGWVLNEMGNCFVSSATVGNMPFTAYFKSETTSAANAPALRMDFGSMNATDLKALEIEDNGLEQGKVYTIEGREVKMNGQALKPGLYIVNNKKMLVR